MNSDQIKVKVEEAKEAVSRFNAKPPMWFYVVAFIVFVVGYQLIRTM